MMMRGWAGGEVRGRGERGEVEGEGEAGKENLLAWLGLVVEQAASVA